MTNIFQVKLFSRPILWALAVITALSFGWSIVLTQFTGWTVWVVSLGIAVAFLTVIGLLSRKFAKTSVARWMQLTTAIAICYLLGVTLTHIFFFLTHPDLSIYYSQDLAINIMSVIVVIVFSCWAAVLHARGYPYKKPRPVLIGLYWMFLVQMVLGLLIWVYFRRINIYFDVKLLSDGILLSALVELFVFVISRPGTLHLPFSAWIILSLGSGELTIIVNMLQSGNLSGIALYTMLLTCGILCTIHFAAMRAYEHAVAPAYLTA